ncbi:NGG1p interacting factor NIF3 [Candidatus Falkowbacteria bacterium RIFCSPLOWO2_12_FULL_45_10]|uniref:NGG1p interacting factor NIF3 n=3 Tax=Candidatus Falkowiibacteriota TaxID=1752728 RepID=A0A1F5RMR8_9BACT|nr:MAG: NGG1p interacting factor NIF3 [Candidatus Falkowbacteria bacterium RIFCSPHIGHO2_02_FULL_45_15]OGF18535.1 MAG: NGG1p interacting factor NIF3 [Candidatus Falkowbacteria bacterium RIFCSPLOWO2_12_FULL_45_10]OGF19962.1 MAG: NGG1p interacting factor NIF3 [Candidatus Falkowbacteria bacterium RIFCSPLOWO2_02_FULL_45_15]
MTIQQIYKLAVELGIKHDLRGPAKVKKYLERAKKKYEKLPKDEQAEFDAEKLTNPYSDTRVLNDTGKQVKKVLVGIDMEVPELLLADKLGDIDLVIAHHPEGQALASLHDVMDLQAEVLAQYGVPINIAESVLRPRISEVSRGISPINHDRAVDAAKILNLGFMCAHTPCDNMAASFMTKFIARKKPETVGEILEALKEIPEYKEAARRKAGPMLFTGSPENSAGKIVVTEFTGGTEGSKEMYEKIAAAGIGTVIGMHMHEEHRKEAEKYHINVVIAGHMSSDSLGVNLFLDELERKGIKITPVSGLIRVKRK